MIIHNRAQADNPSSSLPPYPRRGDRDGRARWWELWRTYYCRAGASADGIHDTTADPTPQRELPPLTRRLPAAILADMHRRPADWRASAARHLRGGGR